LYLAIGCDRQRLRRFSDCIHNSWLLEADKFSFVGDRSLR
jgi:hypothetical protein